MVCIHIIKIINYTHKLVTSQPTLKGGYGYIIEICFWIFGAQLEVLYMSYMYKIHPFRHNFLHQLQKQQQKVKRIYIAAIRLCLLIPYHNLHVISAS